MATLTLRRDSPLTDAERAVVPPGCSIVSGMGDAVLRVDLNMTVSSLLDFAFRLGQAVPGARLEVGGVGALSASLPAHVPSADEAAPGGAPAVMETDRWALLKTGKLEQALALFEGTELDMTGRERIRELFASTDPANVAAAIDVAAATNWRSFATTLRRVLNHGDVGVRTSAARAIGRLAGPALVPALQNMASDPSPDVREAAAEAIRAIEGG